MEAQPPGFFVSSKPLPSPPMRDPGVFSSSSHSEVRPPEFFLFVQYRFA